MGTKAAIAHALSALRASLLTDGYDLSVTGLEAGRLSVSILAGPTACPECLVPKEVMKALIISELRDLTEVRELDVSYPAKH